MTEQRRRFPRIDVEVPAMVAGRPRRAQSSRLASERQRIRQPARITSLSPEGIGLAVAAGTLGDVQLPGARLDVEFALGTHRMAIPASLVWSRSADDERHLGARLHVELTDAGTRQRYAAWIVQQLAEQRKPPAGHGAVQVSASALELARRNRGS